MRGLGLLKDLSQIREIPVKVKDGVPLRIGDVAEVEYGSEIRRGVVTRNGEQEVVAGLVLKLYGENTSTVIKMLYEKVAEVQTALPPGVKLVPYYEQAKLVEQATATVKKAVLEGALLVVIILMLFMGNLRGAIIAVLSLPVCALIAGAACLIASVCTVMLSGASARLPDSMRSPISSGSASCTNCTRSKPDAPAT